jgi:transcriptional regulator GlxA family with amidase domain
MMRVVDLDARVNESAFLYYPRLSAVADYVQAHVAERLTLSGVANLAGLEKKYFSAFFRSKVGITWTEWLRLLRVTRAIERIQVREDSIPRIAFGAGFRDIRTFERAFKRYVGVSPVAYRAAVRPESRASIRKQG